MIYTVIIDHYSSKYNNKVSYILLHKKPLQFSFLQIAVSGNTQILLHIIYNIYIMLNAIFTQCESLL